MTPVTVMKGVQISKLAALLFTRYETRNLIWLAYFPIYSWLVSKRMYNIRRPIPYNAQCLVVQRLLYTGRVLSTGHKAVDHATRFSQHSRRRPGILVDSSSALQRVLSTRNDTQLALISLHIVVSTAAAAGAAAAGRHRDEQMMRLSGVECAHFIVNRRWTLDIEAHVTYSYELLCVRRQCSALMTWQKAEPFRVCHETSAIQVGCISVHVVQSRYCQSRWSATTVLHHTVTADLQNLYLISRRCELDWQYSELQLTLHCLW